MARPQKNKENSDCGKTISSHRFPGNGTAGVRLPMAARSLLPHRPPMLFVDQLLERSGNRAKALAEMPVEGICVDDGMVFPEFFIEVVAQAMAMANGYDALRSGSRMNDGMLVGIDSFSFYHTASPGTRLRIEIEKIFEFGTVKIIHGEVFDADVLLASGDIKVWEDLG